MTFWKAFAITFLFLSALLGAIAAVFWLLTTVYAVYGPLAAAAVMLGMFSAGVALVMSSDD